jgi:hypothetical protein
MSKEDMALAMTSLTPLQQEALLVWRHWQEKSTKAQDLLQRSRQALASLTKDSKPPALPPALPAALSAADTDGLPWLLREIYQAEAVKDKLEPIHYLALHFPWRVVIEEGRLPQVAKDKYK